MLDPVHSWTRWHTRWRTRWHTRLRLALLGGSMLTLTAFGCGSSGATDNGGQPEPVPAFNAARAFNDLVAQVDFGPRVPNTAAHDACRRWMVNVLRPLADSVSEQAFTYDTRTTPRQTLRLTNVIARFAAADGAPPADSLLLGAHWDCRPFADMDPNPANHTKPVPGANDAASGVAVLLELARHFADQPPPRPVTLVLFDLEDAGNTPWTDGEAKYQGYSIGARHFADNMGQDRPNEAIIIDMIGDADLLLRQEPYSLQANPSLVQQVWSIAQRLGFNAFVSELQGAITDDHLPLIEAGVPAIDLIDLNYRYWHTVADTPDKCAPESLQAVGQTLLQLIYRGHDAGAGRAP